MDLRREVRILNADGLHARPCQAIAKAARRYRAALTIASGERVVDGRSILELMTLRAGSGTALELRASGDDAQKLIDSVARLFAEGFGERIDPRA